MAFIVDESNGNITLRQGDTGILSLVGEGITSSHTLYLAIRNSARTKVGTELTATLNNLGEINFEFTKAVTNLLTVPNNAEYQIYYYDVKICNSNGSYQDTSIFGTKGIADVNTIKVYPKTVEGAS